MIENVIVLVSNSVWVFVYRKNKMAAESNIQMVKSKTMALPFPLYILPGLTERIPSKPEMPKSTCSKLLVINFMLIIMREINNSILRSLDNDFAIM